MGEINTTGAARVKYPVDYYEIHITVEARETSSVAAAAKGKKQTEAMLKLLQDRLHINPEELIGQGEKLHQPYNNDNYIFSKEILIRVDADWTLCEAITNILVELDSVHYSVEPHLTDVTEKKRSVMREAVQNARLQAEEIAEMLNVKITGFKQSGFEAYGSEKIRGIAKKCAVDNISHENSMASKLKNKEIELAQSVNIVWLTE